MYDRRFVIKFFFKFHLIKQKNRRKCFSVTEYIYREMWVLLIPEEICDDLKKILVAFMNRNQLKFYKCAVIHKKNLCSFQLTLTYKETHIS